MPLVRLTPLARRKFDGVRGTTYDSADRLAAVVGKTFAHYAVLEKAGAGGMGVVFRARDETLHRDVALKPPSTDNLTDAESCERVLREARAASSETRTLSNIHFLGTNFPFDVSRDGKKLVTTNYQHLSDEIWLLEPAEKK
jgi:serine/threonine protein kinase